MSLPVHEWQVDLGPYTGKAGEKKTLTVTPQCFYHVENIFATDDSSSGPGQGSRIGKLIVGNMLQRPTATGSTLTAIFGVDSSRASKPRTAGGSNEGSVNWDWCPPGSTISVEVEFVQACTFNMSFFGTARG